MAKKKAIVLLAAIFTTLIVMGVACDRVQLSLIPKVASSSIATNEICTSPPEPLHTDIKVLFVVDQSGSNCTQQAIPPACDPSGTDPDKSYRGGLMQTFVTAHQSQSNVSYGLITMSGDNAIALINDGGPTRPIFSNDPVVLATAFQQFAATPDTGATPYKKALALANDAITNDVANSAKRATYFVVMVSDGMPTDYGIPLNLDQITADVKTLVNAGGRATLSAIYYNQLNVVDDVAVLQAMATAGHGGFSNTNIQGKDVPLEEIIALTNSYPWVITQMFVTNLNSAPCDDGTMGVDSDADGICDKDEIRYNTDFKKDPALAARMGSGKFDPQNRNSFHAAYGDLFFYRKILYGQEIDAACALTGSIAVDDADRDLLNTCEEQFIASTTPVGPSPTWTTAMGRTGDPFNFDSDGDGFIDWIEFAYARSQAGSLDFLTPQTTVHGYTMAQILTQHRHPQKPELSTPYDGVLQFSHTNAAGQNCYTYDQTVLPLYPTLAVTQKQVSNFRQLAHGAGGNVILLYFIQKPENALNGPGQLKYFYQTLDTSTTALHLNLDSSQYATYSPDLSRVNIALTDTGPTPTPSPTPAP